jgi:hypothetical protein
MIAPIVPPRATPTNSPIQSNRSPKARPDPRIAPRSVHSRTGRRVIFNESRCSRSLGRFDPERDAVTRAALPHGLNCGLRFALRPEDLRDLAGAKRGDTAPARAGEPPSIPGRKVYLDDESHLEIVGWQVSGLCR